MGGDDGLDAVGATREGSQRLDRWLWAARFFRTRSLARQAVTRGRVEVNGQSAKPARNVVAGDRLGIDTPAARFVVDVLALNEQRRPAAEARQLYAETAESIEARRLEAERRRQRQAGVAFDRARPDRRARRVQRRLRRGDDEP